MGAPRSPFDGPFTWNANTGFANIVANVWRDTRDPLPLDRTLPIGQIWINASTRRAYQCVDVQGGEATWVLIAAFAGDIESLTGDSGGAVFPDEGFDIRLLGDPSSVIEVEGDPDTNTLQLKGFFPYVEEVATTVGAETVTLLELPVPEGQSLACLLSFSALSSLGGLGGILTATARNDGGTASLVVPDMIQYDVPATIAGATAFADTQGDLLRLRVTGTASGGGSVVLHWSGKVTFATSG